MTKYNVTKYNVTKYMLIVGAFLSVFSLGAYAQDNVPAAAQRAESDVEQTVRRFGIGAQAGVGLNPELIDFGVHGTFGPIFSRAVQFRPEVEVGIGELTTRFGINLDVTYTFSGITRDTRWTPYVGAGPNFTLSHTGLSNADIPNESSRFNFGDTSFKPGFEFIAGARRRSGLFFEMNASAYGITNVRLLTGFNF